MARPRTRLLPACLALAILSGCFGPATAPTAPTSSRRPGIPGASTGPSAVPTGAASDRPSGLLPSFVPALTLPPPPVNVASGKPVIRGTVYVPAQIISNNGGSVIGNNGANVIGNNGANVIGNNGANVIGNNGANLISDNGAAVIGQNGANVIGQNGANVIGQNGASVVGQNGANVNGQNGANIISNNGGSVIGNNGASLKFSQYRVANAKVVVKDAAGQPLKDGAGKPVETTTDNFGAYELPAGVVPQNAVIEVTSTELAGNTLSAYLPSDAAKEGAAIDVDIASTLVIGYVLGQYVKGDQALLDKLPRVLADEARFDLAVALDEDDFKEVKVVEATKIEAVVRGAIATAPEVTDVFGRIEKLYVFSGIRDNGDGQIATDIAIGRVSGLLRTSERLYIMSAEKHDLYSVDDTGKLRVIVSSGKWGYPEVLRSYQDVDVHSGIVQQGESLIVADPHYHRVVSVRDGKVETLIGTGVAGSGVALNGPSGLALQADGSLLIADRHNNRVLRRSLDGKVVEVLGGGTETELVLGMPASDIAIRDPQGIAVDGRGHIFVCAYGNNQILELSQSATGEMQLERSWGVIAANDVDVCLGKPYAISNLRGRIYRLDPEGVVDIDAAKLKPISNSVAEVSINLPTSISSSGEKLFVDSYNGCVYSLDLNGGVATVVAGGLISSGDTDRFYSAAKFDVSPSGEIVIADSNSKSVFRVDVNGVSRRIVEAQPEVGFELISEQSMSVRMDVVLDAKWREDGSIVFAVGGGHPCVKLYKDGRVTTLVGDGRISYDTFKPGKAEKISLASPKVILPSMDGKLMILEAGASRLLEMQAEGQVSERGDVGNPTGFLSLEAAFGGGFLTIDRLKNSVVELRAGQSTELFNLKDLPAIVAEGDTRNAIQSPNGDLYIGCKTNVFRRRAKEAVLETIAGPGGKVLTGPERDNSILDLRDLAFAPNGDLLILEGDQVKRIPVGEL